MKRTLPEESGKRKEVPLYRGLFRYFPAALAEVAKVSKIGNDKHNKGSEELFHDRSKSTDHADCILRHLVDLEENRGLDENGVPQVAYIAWRALALAQEWLEKHAEKPKASGAYGSFIKWNKWTELMDEHLKPKKPEVKVGTKLRILKNNPWAAPLKKGAVVEITDIFDEYVIDGKWSFVKINHRDFNGEYEIYEEGVKEKTQ